LDFHKWAVLYDKNKRYYKELLFERLNYVLAKAVGEESTGQATLLGGMMKKSVTIALLLWLLPVPVLAEWEARVVDVYDGDTLILSVGGLAKIIKLFGVDCPEKEQTLGLKAKEFTSNLVQGKKIKVITFKKRKYEICNVYILDKSLNEELLKAGYAWHYKKDSSDKKWAEFERHARSEKRGIWSKEGSIPPWDFRGDIERVDILKTHTIKWPTPHKAFSTRQVIRRPTPSRSQRARPKTK
jgi:endonuclease YncB( thermonuclease family)